MEKIVVEQTSDAMNVTVIPYSSDITHMRQSEDLIAMFNSNLPDLILSLASFLTPEQKTQLVDNLNNPIH